jgi:hypothetical protein
MREGKGGWKKGVYEGSILKVFMYNRPPSE